DRLNPYRQKTCRPKPVRVLQSPVSTPFLRAVPTGLWNELPRLRHFVHECRILDTSIPEWLGPIHVKTKDNRCSSNSGVTTCVSPGEACCEPRHSRERPCS